MSGRHALLSGLLSINSDTVRVAVRGFRVVDSHIAGHLEHIGHVFLLGYHLALADPNSSSLRLRLDKISNEDRGFAYEGAAMGLGMRDIFFNRRWNNFFRFLTEIAGRHTYLAHVGIGWAMAAIPWTRYRVAKAITTLDPLFRWLAVDGYGFHDGYFNARKYVVAGKQCRWLTGYQRCAFDQGLGRSLWFVEGADPMQINRRITALSPRRRGDLWSGVGLACSYAGGVDSDTICHLKDVAGCHRAELSLGAVFAAKARSRAGNLTPATEEACSVLCGLTATGAAQIADECLSDVACVEDATRYEAWRQAVRSRFDCRREAIVNSQGVLP